MNTDSTQENLLTVQQDLLSVGVDMAETYLIFQMFALAYQFHII